ncbi:MAG: glycyl-radical enzyme activating protein [Clostridia bacterium]|nr:glycyl-radical enzyme activating protein [Clostridia bacterium]
MEQNEGNGHLGTKGLVFDIQRYAIHDGPGIRTLVFVKGCPLHCPWCCNPESISRFPELAYFKKRCIGCGKCVEVCPHGAISFSQDEGFVADRDKCQACGECAKVCPPKARVISGTAYSVDDVLRVVERDRPFYRRSGGGLTVSGGEVLLQHEFVRELLEEAHRRLLHTAIETSGYGPWQNLEAIVAHTDYVFMDVKHMDSERHRQVVGVSNEIILQNARRVSELVAEEPSRRELVIRIPVIPDFNDSESNIRATAAFVREEVRSARKIELLAYHRLGESKWERIGKQCPTRGLEPPTKDKMDVLRRIVEDAGLDCQVRR